MRALTPPHVLAAGQHAMPLVVVYTLHVPSPLQHAVLRPGPQLLAAEQQALPLHATLAGHVCNAPTRCRHFVSAGHRMLWHKPCAWLAPCTVTDAKARTTTQETPSASLQLWQRL